MSSAIEVQIAPEYKADSRRLSQAGETTLQQHQRAGCGLTIVVTNDESVQSLNRQYRQLDAVTDVLSFPANALPQPVAIQSQYLGDIVIAFPHVSEEARRSSIALSDLLCMLVVHGALHILGFDHDSPESWKRMWAAQSAALQALRIDPDLVARYGGLVFE